jgi:hypothetical protein
MNKIPVWQNHCGVFTIDPVTGMHLEIRPSELGGRERERGTLEAKKNELERLIGTKTVLDNLGKMD